MSTTIQTETKGRIAIDVPAVPIHKLAADEQSRRYGMSRVTLIQLPKDKRSYWALPGGLLEGWEGWTLQATNGRALVILPVFPAITWKDPIDAETGHRWSWNAKEYGRVVGKKAKSRDGFHRLELEGDPILTEGRWMSETSGGFLDGIHGDGHKSGDWPRVDAVMPDGPGPGLPVLGANAKYLAMVQDCIADPRQPGIKINAPKDRTSPFVLQGSRGYGVVMSITMD